MTILRDEPSARRLARANVPAPSAESPRKPGPHMGDARATGGLELYAAGQGNGPRQCVIAGDVRDGPTLEVWVPDRRDAHLYKDRAVEVAGEDHRLLDAGDHRARITSN